MRKIDVPTMEDPPEPIAIWVAQASRLKTQIQQNKVVLVPKCCIIYAKLLRMDPASNMYMSCPRESCIRVYLYISSFFYILFVSLLLPPIIYT